MERTSYSNLFVQIEILSKMSRIREEKAESVLPSALISLPLPPSLLCNYVTLHLTTQRIKFNGGSHVRQTAIRWLIIPFCSLMNRDFHRIVVAVHPLSSGCLPFSSLRFKLANLSENSSARKGWSRSAIINPEESRLIGN